MTMEKDYKNNNIFYENTAALNIGNQEETVDTTPSKSITPVKNRKYNVSLTDDEKKAQEDGFFKSRMGVAMPRLDEYSKADVKDILGSSNLSTATQTKKEGEPAFEEVQGDSAASYGEDATPASILYKNTLGRTSYQNLKYACGLKADDSYTDYYNKTHYVPKGYEMESRLLLAEEKRMKLYAEYEAGNLSETDFLYQAYGKDLMKENGVDLSSTLYWYNKAQKNDFTNPLDSDTFLSDLISNARSLWQAESWFKDVANKELDSALAGIVTGSQLSNEKVYDLFKTQFDALAPYFNDDYKKVITYYQAGSLGSAFNPFLDIDGDNKPDYYYHTNGKLYAVKGSSGTGDATCEIKYDDNGNMASVEINEGIEGGFGGFFEGLGSFLQTFIDLGAMLWSATFGSIGKDEYFVESYQDYKAGMQRTFSNEDIQFFNGNHDWGYEISKGIGNVTGQIVLNVALALLTYGAGNVAYAGGQATVGTMAKTIGTAAAKSIGYAAAGAAVGAGVGAVTAGVTGQENVGEAALTGAGIGALMGAGIGFSGALGASDDVARASTNLNSAVKLGTIVDKAGNVVKANASVLQKGTYYTTKFVGFVTKANSGAVFSGASRFGRIGNASILALKDFANVYANLSSTNHILNYYEKERPDLGIKALSYGEIIGRATLAAGVDILISSTMRLQDDMGITGYAKKAKLGLGGTLDYKGQTITNEVFYSLSPANRSLILNYAKNMPTLAIEAGIDNVFDVVENLLTMATTAAVSNPYAELGSAESWKTFASSMVTPQSIIQNLYITARNALNYKGNTSTFRKRQQSLLIEKVPSVMSKADSVLSNLINSTDDLKLKDTFIQLSRDFHEKAGTQSFESMRNTADATMTKDANSYYDNALNAIRELDKVFDKDIAQLNEGQRKIVIEALGITDKKFNELAQAIANGKAEGVFTALLLDEAKAENAKIVLDVMQQNLSNIHEVFEKEENNYKLAFFGGFKNLFAENKGMFDLGWKSFKEYMNKNMSDSKLREVLSNMKLESQFPTQRLQAVSDTLKSIPREKIEQYFDYTIEDALSIFRGAALKVEQDEEGNTHIKWDMRMKSSKTASKPENLAKKTILMNIVSDKELLNMFIKNGVFSYDEKGNLVVGESPCLIIAARPEKMNDIKATENTDLANYLYALEELSSLSTKTNPAGEYLINSDTPLCLKVEIDTSNGSGGVSKRPYYVIPTAIHMNNIDKIARFEMANKLISALYTLKSDTVTQKQINDALVILGVATQPDAVNGNLSFLQNKSIDELEASDLEKLKCLGLSSVLASTDLTNVKSKTGFSRALILKMCSWEGHTGIIHPSDLEAIIKDYEANPKNGAFNEQTYKSAVHLKQYIEKLPEIDKAINILKKYVDKAPQANVKWKGPDIEAIAKLSMDLNKPENEWLKNSLIEDGNIPSEILRTIITDKDAMLPFLKGLETIASSLVHSDLEANYSDEQKQALTNFVNDLLRNYTTNYKQISAEIARPATEIFRDYLYNQRSVSRDALKDSLNKFDSIKNDVDLFEAVADSIETNLAKMEGKKQTASGKEQPYTNSLDSLVEFELQTYINKARQTNTRDVQGLMSKLYSLWDASGTKEQFDEYQKIREDFVNSKQQEINDFKQEIKDALSVDYQQLEDETNILGLRNLARYFIANSRNAFVVDTSALKDTLEKYKDLINDYNSKSAPITRINSLHNAIIDAFETFEKHPKYAAYTSANTQISNDRKILGSYSYLLNLDNDSLSRFLEDPIGYLASEKKIAKSLSTNYDSRIDAMLADLKSNAYSKESIWVNMLSTIEGPIKDVDHLYNILSSDQPSKVKDYVMYAISIFDKSSDTSIPNYKLLHRSNMKGINYKGTNIFDILADNKNHIAKFIANENSVIIDRLTKDVERYHNFLYTNTDIIENPNVIEVNPIDLVPANYAKLLRLLEQSKDFLRNTAQDALGQKDVLSEIQQILRNSGYGNLFDSQLAVYLERIEDFSKANASLTPYIIDLNDADAVREFKRTLSLLGYTDSDFLKMQSKEPYQIPGVLYKNVQTRGIKTSLDAQSVYKYINSSIKVAYAKENKGFYKNYNDILENMFYSSYAFTDSTPVNLTNEDGSYTKLFGYFNNFSQEPFAKRASAALVENTIKSGLVGGDFSKVKSIINDGVAFSDSDVDPISKNTLDVLKLISSVEHFYSTDVSAKSYTFEIAVKSKKTADNIVSQAKKTLTNNSLFKLLPDITEANGIYRINFIYNKDFDFNKFRENLTDEFSIQQLIPIFYANENMNLSQHSSNMNILNYIYQSKVEGFETLEDLINNIVNPTKIYSLNETEYNDFLNTLNKGKTTIGEIKQALKNKKTNNYYIKALDNYIKTGEASIEFLNSLKQPTTNTRHPEQQIDITLLNNYFIRKATGTVLNDERYKDLFNLRDTDEQEYSKTLTNVVADIIKACNNQSLDESIKDTFTDSLSYFDPRITSSSISKLKISNADQAKNLDSNLLYYTLDELIHTINFNDTFVYSPKSMGDLPFHNSKSAILSVLESVNGKLYINLDYLLTLNNKDKAEIISTFKDIKKNASTIFGDKASEMVKEINRVLNVYNSKLDVLKDMLAMKDSDTVDIAIRHEVMYPNTPTNEITNHVITNGKLSEAEFAKLASISQNNFLAKKPYARFLPSSSLKDYDSNSDYSPFVKMYSDAINALLYPSVDKQGSTIVYNMNSAEARSAYLTTMISFSSLLKDFKINNKLLFDFNGAGVDDVKKYEALMKIYHYANLYSTGTTYDSEFTGALIVSWKEGTADVEINPVKVSSSDVDGSILKSLFAGDKLLTDMYKEKGTKHVLMQLDKNTFKQNISGLNSDIKFYDLDDTTTQQRLFSTLIYKARGSYYSDDSFTPDMSVSEAMIKYCADYKTNQATYSDRMNNLTTILTDVAQVPKSIASRIIHSIQTLNVANETNWSDQRMNTIIKDILTPIEPYMDNKQLKVVRDIFIHGISKTALSSEAMAKLDNERILLESSIKNDKVFTVANDMASIIDGTISKDSLNSLSSEEKVQALKLFMLNRRDGSDLEYMLSGEDALKVHNDIVKKSSDMDQALIRKYDETTGKFSYVDWSKIARNGKPTTVAGKNPYNALHKSNWANFDSEWLTGLDNRLYQLAFITGKAVPQGFKTKEELFSKAEATKHVILVSSNLIDGALQLNEDSKNDTTKYYHVESNESFKQKRDLSLNPNLATNTLNGVTFKESLDKETNVKTYIVADTESAFKLMEALTKDCETLMGFNNTSEGSDNSWLEQYESGRNILNNMDDVDIRLDVVNSTETSDETLKLQSKDSLQHYKEVGIITGANAHDALSDIEDSLELYIHVINNRENVTELYDEEWSNLLKTGFTEDEIKEALTFKNINPQDYKLVDDDYFDYSVQKKNNSTLKILLDAYNIQDEYSYTRVRQKELHQKVQDLILGNTTHRKDFVDSWYFSVKDNYKRSAVTNILYNLMRIASGNSLLENLDPDALRTLYYAKDKNGKSIINSNSALNVLDRAIINYKDTLNKNSDVDSYITNDEASKRFLSLPTDEMLPYINKVIGLKLEDKTLLESAPENFFNQKRVDGSTVLQILSSDDVVNLSDMNSNYTKNTLILSILKPLYDKVLSSDEAKKAPKFFSTLTNNIVKMIGDYSDTDKKYIKTRQKDLLTFASSLDKDLKDFLIKSFSMEDGFYYQSKSLYTMGTEKGEFSDYLRDKGEYGTIYIGEDLLYKAYPSLKDSSLIQEDNGTKYLYTNILRQPGQGKTTHLMKFIIEPGSGLQMTRATAQSYFNGDFDGDFYFICNPDETMQTVGKDLHKYLTYGASILDIFDDIKIKSDTIDTTKTSSTLKSKLKADFDNLFKLSKTNSSKLYSTYIEVKQKAENIIKGYNNLPEDYFETFWSTYAPQLYRMKDANGKLGYYLYYTDSEYYRNADKSTKELIDRADRIRTYSNQFYNNYDSQVVGGIAKALLHRNYADVNTDGSETDYKTLTPNDILYNADISLNEHSINHLQSILSSTDNATIVSRLTSYIDSLDAAIFSQDSKKSLKSFITSVPEIKAKDIIGIAQVIQKYVQYSKVYNDALSNAIKNNLNVYTQQYKDKLTLLEDYCSKQPMTFGYQAPETDINSMSGPQVLQRTAYLLDRIKKYSSINTTNLQTFKNSSYRKLLGRLITDGELNIINARDLNIISPKGTSSYETVYKNNSSQVDYHQVGLTKMKIMILDDETRTDTAISTKYNKLRNNQIFSIDYANQQESLQNLQAFDGKTVTGLELNKATNSNDFNNNLKYRIAKGKRGLISFAINSSFNSLVEGGYVKISNAYGKGLKSTVSQKIDDTDIKGIQPDMLVSKALFDKLSSKANVKELGNATYTSNGRTYKVYEVDNMTLLNSWVDNALSNKVRASDKISILQGLDEVTAFMNLGTMALEIDGDNIRFNPEGINAINAALNSFTLPDLSEANAADDINITKIASILLTVDTDTAEALLKDIHNLSSLNVEDALLELYSKKDIGGEYGDSIIKTLQTRLASMKDGEEIKNKILSNPIYKTAWQQSIDDASKNWVLTSADTGTEEYFRSKRDNSEVNRRYTNMHYKNISDARYIASSNSAYDLTSYYYGRVQYVQDLLSNISERPMRISKGFLKALADTDLIQKERLIRGAQPNGFYPILERNAVKIDASKFYEGNPLFKAGNHEEVDTRLINDSNYQALGGIIKNSAGSIDRTNDDYIRKFLKEDGSYFPLETIPQYSHSSLMPFITNGDEVEILQAMNNHKYTAEGTLDRPVLTLKDSKLEVGNYHKTLNASYLEDYQKKQKEYLGSSKQAMLTNEKLKSAEYKINTSNETLSEITNIADLLNSNSFEFNADVKKVLDSFSSEDLEKEMSFKPMSDFLVSQLTEENIINAINLSRLDNGIDLYTAPLRSWGYAAKDGKDISLGQRTLYLNNQVKQYLNKLLGDEYSSLIFIFNKDKALGNIIDKYIDAEYKLDLYDKLTGSGKETAIKNLGKGKYNEYLEDVKTLILGSSSAKLEDAVNTLRTNLESIKNNPDMFTLLNDDESKGKLGLITRLNNRLLEEAQKNSPYSLLGYYMPIYKNQKDMKKSMVPSYITAWNIKTEVTKDILNGYTKDKYKNVHIASRLYDTDEGYLGMISRIAQNYAVTNTMKEFNKFLQTSGYMRNLEVFSTAQKILTTSMNDAFVKSFADIYGEDEQRFEYDKETYGILKANVETYTKEYLDEKYAGPESFVLLYNAIFESRTKAFDNLGITSRHELEDLKLKANVPGSSEQINKAVIDTALTIDDVYQNTIAVMINILEENDSREANSFLISLYNETLKTLASSNYLNDFELVDSRGAALNNDGKFPVALPLNMEDILQEVKLNSASSREAEIAKMMLTGDVYLMRKSVSEQLMKKVYTQYQPGIIGRTLNKARNYVTGYIMATPANLVDRVANFTIFDFGTLASADAMAMKYVFPAISTVEKYVMHPEYITEETINTDKNLQYLLRYMAATGQSPINNNIYQGDEFKIINIPLIRDYMKIASNALSKQQFYMRLAYFMDLVENGEKNDFNLNPTKFGVAFHLRQGLKDIDADNSNAPIYNAIFNKEQGRYYNLSDDGDYLKRMMNMDAAAVQVVAENVGIFGNMPYASKWLSSRLGMMFTGFPMAGVRWGAHRLQSLANAFTTFNQVESRHYLYRNLGSTVLTYAVLVALQALFSQDTRDYLEEKLKGKKDEEIKEELGEDKIKNAENILFRGGCVKLFDSWLKHQESTSAAQSRDMIAHLWQSYAADYLLNKDEKATETFWNYFKKNLWGHQNVLIKDTIESIPGNTALQTYNWFEPSDNFFENVSRKALGYFLGNAQANGFMDSMKASAYEDDQSFIKKLGVGMRHAFVDDTTGIKEYKSEYRNYKKAFSIVYKYLTSTTDYTDEYIESDTKNFKTIKAELTNCLKEKASASAFYKVIQKYLDEGMSLSTVKSAVSSCSLRSKLLKLSDINDFKDFMSDSELAVIKTALAYEDYMFPYLTSYIEDLEEDYRRLHKNTKSSNYTNSIASILKSMTYNTPTYYSNINYNNYIKQTRFYDQLSKSKYRNSYNNTNPSEAYTNMMNIANYGTSKDIWGNETQHYKDGTTYTKRERGFNPFEEENK